MICTHYIWLMKGLLKGLFLCSNHTPRNNSFIYPFLTYSRLFPYNPKSLFTFYFFIFKHLKLFSPSFSTFYPFIILLCESALNRTWIMLIHVLVCLLFSLACPKTRVINLTMYQIISLSFNWNLCMFILWTIIYYFCLKSEPGIQN